MRLLFIGDIFAGVGRRAVAKALPEMRGELSPDLVVANCENAAGGSGITRKLHDELLGMGIDLLTSGNHVWKRQDVFRFIGDEDCKLVRPANYPPGAPGRGYRIVKAQDGSKVAIINLLGRVNLERVDCPFRRADEIIAELEGTVATIVVDFHAETTSEKVALGWYLNGRVGAVIGTHTHVPTADGRVLPDGTAYITDVGMTGAMDSIIGLERKNMISRFISAIPTKWQPARDNPGLDSVVVDFANDGRATQIEFRRRFVEL